MYDDLLQGWAEARCSPTALTLAYQQRRVEGVDHEAALESVAREIGADRSTVLRILRHAAGRRAETPARSESKRPPGSERPSQPKRPSGSRRQRAERWLYREARREPGAMAHTEAVALVADTFGQRPEVVEQRCRWDRKMAELPQSASESVNDE